MWCLPHCFLPRTWDSAYCGGSKNNSLTVPSCLPSSASAHHSTLLRDAGPSTTMLPRLPGQLASLSSSHKRYGQKEGWKREGPYLALGCCWNPSSSSSGSFLYLAQGSCSSFVAPCPWSLHQPHVAHPPSSHWVLVIALLFLYPSPISGSFLQTLISQLLDFSTFVLLAF